MGGLTRGRGAVRNEGLGKRGTDITFINFPPFPVQRNSLFLPFTNLWLLWSLSDLYYYCVITTNREVSAEGKCPNQLHLASPSKQRWVFRPQCARDGDN